MPDSFNHSVNLRNLLKLCVLIFIILISQQVLGQQRAQFTQYITNELLINPAYAGAEEALSVSLLHRAQWSEIEGGPTTQAFTAHSLIKSHKVGLGLAVVNDKLGVHNILNVSTSFAYRIQIKRETFISLGLQFGVNQIKSDFNSLAGQIQTANDPKLNAASISTTNFEFGSGIYLLTPRLNLGISMPNMLNTNSMPDSAGHSLLDNNIYFLGRYSMTVTNNVNIQPGFLVKYINGLPLSLDVNLSAVINKVLLVGVSYRIQESINPLVQAKITPQLKIGYAFDYPLMTVESYGNSSHEFMLSYLFSFSQHNVSRLR